MSTATCRMVSHCLIGHGWASRHAANTANTANRPMPTSSGSRGISRSIQNAHTSTAVLWPAMAQMRNQARLRKRVRGPMRCWVVGRFMDAILAFSSVPLWKEVKGARAKAVVKPAPDVASAQDRPLSTVKVAMPQPSPRRGRGSGDVKPLRYARPAAAYAHRRGYATGDSSMAASPRRSPYRRCPRSPAC